VVDRATWTPPPEFALAQRLGGLSQPDIEATLNMGVGMALVLPEPAVSAAQRTLDARGVRSWVAGQVALTRHERRTLEWVWLLGSLGRTKKQ
jgi:phosphoribosylformylglycinamidine cyclo-ligase